MCIYISVCVCIVFGKIDIVYDVIEFWFEIKRFSFCFNFLFLYMFFVFRGFILK